MTHARRLGITLLVSISAAVLAAGLSASRPPARITFDLNPEKLTYPLAMLKLDSPDCPAPTFFVGRGEWGSIKIDLNQPSRSRARGLVALPHIELSDPALAIRMIGSSWTNRAGRSTVEIKINRIERITLDRDTGRLQGEITLDLDILGLPRDLTILAHGTYLIEENGVATRTNVELLGDLLTIEVTAEAPAAAFDPSRAPTDDEPDPRAPITLTLWFQAADVAP
ncbi:MAG: hypothetical protein KAS72_07665 [Phycisphaerales bacterium]|nr:hypothetical protein [Phycisphaerales bacterium]